MSEISRWTYYEGDGQWKFPGFVERDDGDWVEWEDHKAVIQDMKEQIWKLKDDLEAARMEAGGYA